MKKILLALKNMPIGVKASFWFTVSSFLQKGISFLATPIYTRILTEAEYGGFSVYQAWQQIISIVSVIAADRCVTIGFMKFSIDRNTSGNDDVDSINIFTYISVIDE